MTWLHREVVGGRLIMGLPLPNSDRQLVLQLFELTTQIPFARLVMHKVIQLFCIACGSLKNGKKNDNPKTRGTSSFVAFFLRRPNIS